MLQMWRVLIVGILVTGMASAASAQAYNPATPVGPPPILPATPPAAIPGMNPQPAPVGNDSRTHQENVRPNIGLGRPSAETHNDRSIRCSGQAAGLGIPPGSTGSYVRDCVNSR
jgi:hypothetical protein